jgi:ATP-binding cassette, subfamily A (ABC1), member 3
MRESSKPPKTSLWEKFVLLSWKNWVIQLRHPVQTFFEILVPIIVCFMIFFIRNEAKVTEFKDATVYHPLDIDTINSTIFDANLANPSLFFSPNNSVLRELMRNVGRDLFIYDVHAKKNSTDLEDASRRLNPFASIEFDDDWEVSCLEILKYIRDFNTNLTSTVHHQTSRRHHLLNSFPR